MRKYKDDIFLWFSRLWNCYIWKFHDWTSDAQEGIEPPDLTGMSTEEILESFFKFAELRCKRCKHVSDLSKRVQNDQARKNAIIPDNEMGVGNNRRLGF